MADITKSELKAEWKVMLRRLIIALNRAEKAEAIGRQLESALFDIAATMCHECDAADKAYTALKGAADHARE